MGSLFGASSDQKQAMGTMKNLSGFASQLGQNDLTTASNYMQDILSGDSSKIGKLLAPQISGIKKRGEQQKGELAQFGGRSGGSGASINTINADVGSSINDLISSLTQSSLSGLTSIGGNLLNTAEGAASGWGNMASTIRSQNMGGIGQMFDMAKTMAGATAGGISGGIQGGAGQGWADVASSL